MDREELCCGFKEFRAFQVRKSHQNLILSRRLSRDIKKEGDENKRSKKAVEGKAAIQKELQDLRKYQTRVG